MIYRPTFLIALVVATLVLPVGRLSSQLRQNLATTVVNRTLWQDEVLAVDRQRSLALAAGLLASASGRPAALTALDVGDSHSMLSSILTAEHFRRQGDYVMAAAWLRLAASAPPHPHTQAAIKLPAVMGLAADGSMVIPGNSSIWEVRGDTEPDAWVAVAADGTGTFGLRYDPATRTRAGYSWSFPLSIPYHHSISVRARTSRGCSLMLETVVDGVRTRHFVSDGTGEWETLEATIQGDNLRFIDLLLDLDTSHGASGCTECSAEIASIVFEFDGE